MNAGRKLLTALLLMPALLAALCAASAESGGILTDTRFPDMAFREALDRMYGDANHHVNFLRTEIDVCDWGISDLTGIELFTNLTDLNCSGNNLTVLDLDQNTGLVSLDCRNNPLAVLNTSALENLQVLYCSGESLATLHLPTNRSRLRILDISGTGISTLDVGGFSALEGVNCIGGALTSLDAAGCGRLEEITCSGSPLSALDVTQCSRLGFLTVDGCSFTSLTLSDLGGLLTLKCDHNPMASLSLSGCPLLEDVDCSGCQLGTLYIASCGSLIDLNCSDNRLTSLSGIPTLIDLNCSGNRLTQLGAFPELMELNCANNRLTELDAPETLWSLDCSGNRLTGLDLSPCAELTWAVCSGNLLTTLTLTGAGELSTLIAHQNRLTTLDIEGTGLEEASWAGETEYEGFTVRAWNNDLIFDPSVTLVRGQTVIYSPDPGDTPLPTLFLPYGLVTIEADAFNGIAAEAVLIPDTVTTISGDPFAGSRVRCIYGYAGSAAEDFARGRYQFVAVEESE